MRGKDILLAVLNFNNSPITHLVALKYGSVRELVISVILNSVGPALTGGLRGNERHSVNIKPNRIKNVNTL